MGSREGEAFRGWGCLGAQEVRLQEAVGGPASSASLSSFPQTRAPLGTRKLPDTCGDPPQPFPGTREAGWPLRPVLQGLRGQPWAAALSAALHVWIPLPQPPPSCPAGRFHAGP